MNDLLIKAYDDTQYRNGYDYYHVRMGSGFMDAIENGLQLKETIENASRLENGTRMLVSTKVASRTVTLRFNIFGSTRSEYMTNKRAFETMLKKGLVDIRINDNDHPDIYHLVYTGKSVTYNHSYSGVFGIMTYQFAEPNPANRTVTPNAHVHVIETV